MKEMNRSISVYVLSLIDKVLIQAINNRLQRSSVFIW